MIDANHVVPQLHPLGVGVIELRPGVERVAPALGIDQTIEAVKEMRLVADDRPADGAAPIGLRRIRLGQAALRHEEIAGRDAVAGVAAEQAAVDRIGALLRDGVNHRAGSAAKLRVVLIGQHLEFLHRFERRARLAAAR